MNKKSNNKILELDSYRGIAAFLVVIFHVFQHSSSFSAFYGNPNPWFYYFFANLDSAVACFFVLSGFLNFYPFVDDIAGGVNKISTKGFLIRRFIRIIPVYFFAILFVWTSRFTGGHEQILDLFEHLTFTQVFDSKHIFWTIGPAWSLANEVWFYILIVYSIPFIKKISTYLTKFGRQTFLFYFCFGLICLSVIFKALTFFVFQKPFTEYAFYFNPIAMLDSFAIGMVFAVISNFYNQRYRLSSFTPLLLRLFGLFIIVLAFYFRRQNDFFELYFFTLVSLGFAGILASSVGWPENILWKKIVIIAPFQYLGLISYSLYLWHEPLLMFIDKYKILTEFSANLFLLNALFVADASILVATLSYWILEYPLTYLKFMFANDGKILSFPKE